MHYPGSSMSFPSSQTCSSEKHARKLSNCRNDFFSYFLIWHVKRTEQQKYNIKYWGQGSCWGNTRVKNVTLRVDIGLTY